MRHFTSLLIATFLVSCTPAVDDTDTTRPPSSLSARQQLRRASLDIRARLPTADELAAVDADPTRLDALIDSFVDDRAFGTTVKDLFARAFRTRFEEYFNPDFGDYGEDPFWQFSIAEEPLMLLQAIAQQDRPFTDLVQAEETYVNEALALQYPVDGYDDEQGGWQAVRYNDGRPLAGVLSMSSMYFRYSTCGQNYNRGRANAFSRILLCDNYLKRPVDFPRDIDLTDEEGIRNAVTQNVACTSCHASLDPLAAFMFGFDNDEGGDPQAFWDARLAGGWRDATGAHPAYHGQPADDFTGLGRLIADDPRFVRCAATRVMEGLLGRPTTAADFDAVTAHTDAFVAGGLTLRALFRSVLRDNVYIGAVDGAREQVPAKLITPEILEGVLDDLTGYRATSDGVDLMRSDLEGLHVLAGGLDARSGDHPATAPSTSRVLVHERLAEAAAAHVIDRGGPLIRDVDTDARPDEDELTSVVERATALEPDLARALAVELQALWDEIVEDGVPERDAWVAILSALLRDSSFVLY